MTAEELVDTDHFNTSRCICVFFIGSKCTTTLYLVNGFVTSTATFCLSRLVVRFRCRFKRHFTELLEEFDIFVYAISVFVGYQSPRKLIIVTRFKNLQGQSRDLELGDGNIGTEYYLNCTVTNSLATYFVILMIHSGTKVKRLQFITQLCPAMKSCTTTY